MIRAIELPKVDANVTRAKVVKWLVREGDWVAVGSPLVEIETEKAVFVIEAGRAGVVRRILVGEGGRPAVGARLGVIGDAGAAWPDEPPATGSPIAAQDTRTAGLPRAVGGKIADDYAVADYSDALLGE